MVFFLGSLIWDYGVGLAYIYWRIASLKYMGLVSFSYVEYFTRTEYDVLALA
jgi:hypothetical protein